MIGFVRTCVFDMAWFGLFVFIVFYSLHCTILVLHLYTVTNYLLMDC